MVKYNIILERTYLNSCELTYPDGTKAFTWNNLQLEPGIRLSIRMRPKGEAIPGRPSQLTNMCVIKVEGVFMSELSEAEIFELHDEPQNFRDSFKPFIDAAVFFLSKAVSSWLFLELESETLRIKIGNQFAEISDVHTLKGYRGLSGNIGLKKLEPAFRNLTLLSQENREFLAPFFRAFHWHAVAVERIDPTDSFIAAFTGLEVILNTERFPRDKEDRDHLKDIEDLIRNTQTPNKDDLLAFLGKRKGSILRPPLRSRLETLLTNASSPYKEEELQEFDKVNDLRNEILHGRTIEVPDIPLIVFNPRPFENPLQSILTLLERGIFYALKSRTRSGDTRIKNY